MRGAKCIYEVALLSNSRYIATTMLLFGNMFGANDDDDDDDVV